jgi:hypothetical protein
VIAPCVLVGLDEVVLVGLDEVVRTVREGHTPGNSSGSSRLVYPMRVASRPISDYL